MYQNRLVLCFILARGSSKGLPRKNVLMLAGKPLIAHSIDVAKNVKYIDKIYVSTEDNEIKEIALRFGASVIDRPPELATDSAIALDSLKHMIQSIPNATKENPIVVWFHVTSPIREIVDVEKCIEMFDSETDCVVSVGEMKIHPSYAMTLKNGILSYYLDIPRMANRQESEPLYFLNGSVVVTDCKFLLNQKRIPIGGRMKGFVMDEKHSTDIDSRLEFEFCKFIMENGKSII